MASKLSKANGNNNSIPSASRAAMNRAGHPGGPALLSINSVYNSQLLTHYGYYLSPQPTIQQLKK